MWRCHAMEYRGIEYQVVQTANPTGWRWTVEVAGGTLRRGTGYNRVHAIGLAQRAIDRLLGNPKKVTGPQQIIPAQPSAEVE